MSIPNSFEDEESLYDYLSSRGLSLRKPNPVLKLRPHIPKPQNPETYQGYTTKHPYLIQAPEKDPNYVWVNNRENDIGRWHRIGDPITQELVGKQSYDATGEDKVFQPWHHNINVSQESNLSQEALQNKLRNDFNFPAESLEGDRSTLFKRIINTKETPEFSERLQTGGQPTELEMSDIINRHEPINLQQAARLRELRNNQNNPPQVNQAPQENSNLNPSNWSVPTIPTRLDGSQVSNAEANSLRQWGEQNLTNQANNASMLNRLGTGSNPMTVNSLGAKGLASTGEAALGAEGAAASGATFASRAMPMMSLALMAGSLVQNSRANQQMKQDQEQQKSMRT